MKLAGLVASGPVDSVALPVITDEDGGAKVLLTNTIYPLKPGPVLKPKLRLRSKMSPELVVRAVSATAVAAPFPASDLWTRFSPGGAWGEWGEDDDEAESSEGLELLYSVGDGDGGDDSTLGFQKMNLAPQEQTDSSG